MRPLWRDLLRFAAEWVLLILIGGGLGWGAAWAVRAGVASERAVLIGFGVLIAGASAFAIWSARTAYLLPWDDWDDDPDDPTDS